MELRYLTRLNARLDAVLTEFGKMSDDTFKSVWRHNYKKTKKALRGGNLDKLGGFGSGELPDGNKNMLSKSGLMWRGTHKGEVEKIARGRFKSEWTTPYAKGKKATYVAGYPAMTEGYAATAAAHAGNRGAMNATRGMAGLFRSPEQKEAIVKSIPNARIYGISNKAFKRSDDKIRRAIGDYAQTAPIRGGIAAREVRVLLKPKIAGKRVKWSPAPLGDITQKNFSAIHGGVR